MGGGSGDLNAWEKSALGWLGGIARPRRNGDARARPCRGADDAAAGAGRHDRGERVLVRVTRARRRPRSPASPGSRRGSPCSRGPRAGGELSAYPRANLLLPNPAGGGRYAYAPGEAFVRPGIFRVTVERHALESAALRFEWLDRVGPGRPRLRVRTTRGRVRLSWDAARERGSGIDSYTVVIDGRGGAEVPLRDPAHDLDGCFPAGAGLPSGRGLCDRSGREPRTTGVGPRPDPLGRQGRMFWLSRKTLSGSHSRLSATSRSALASP